MQRESRSFMTIDDNDINNKLSDEVKVDASKEEPVIIAPVNDKEEPPLLIFGLNPKDPQDWITVGLSTVIVYNGVQMIGELVQGLTQIK